MAVTARGAYGCLQCAQLFPEGFFIFSEFIALEVRSYYYCRSSLSFSVTAVSAMCYSLQFHSNFGRVGLAYE